MCNIYRAITGIQKKWYIVEFIVIREKRKSVAF